MIRFQFPSLIALVAISIFTTIAAFADDSVSFAEKHDLDSGSSRGHCILEVAETTVESAKPLTLEVRFFNTSGGQNFYNPFFNSLVPLPAQLVLYDTDKKCLGDLLIDRQNGSHRRVSAFDWTYIPSLCNVGSSLKVILQGHPPGDYYLQLVYCKAFLAQEPTVTTTHDEKELQDRENEFSKHFDHAELFRSNVVKITIIK